MVDEITIIPIKCAIPTLQVLSITLLYRGVLNLILTTNL